MKTEILAFDRGTLRRIDVDGRLHVEVNPISKANVCPYFGHEIPIEGLEQDRVYYLLRDPDELAKGASTFNGIQVLDLHTPLNSKDPKKERVVGCTGNTAKFNAPYLTNSISIWDEELIDLINSGEQRELSSSYRYVPDMTPGVYEGVPYDGRMTNIVGNHVALVSVGRAGADVLVSDQLPNGKRMTKKKLAAVEAALRADLRAKLAADSGIDFDMLARKVALAYDEKCMDEDDDPDMADDEDEKKDKKADDADGPEDRSKAACDEDDKKADDEDEKSNGFHENESDKSKEQKEDRKEDLKEKREKRADDSALISKMRADFRATREAENAVRHIVGEIPAMDSAAEVYAYALKASGIDVRGVHESAYPAMVKMLNKQGVASDAKPNLAADGDSMKSILPNFKPVRTI